MIIRDLYRSLGSKGTSWSSSDMKSKASDGY